MEVAMTDAEINEALNELEKMKPCHISLDWKGSWEEVLKNQKLCNILEKMDNYRSFLDARINSAEVRVQLLSYQVVSKAEDWTEGSQLHALDERRMLHFNELLNACKGTLTVLTEQRRVFADRFILLTNILCSMNKNA